jgi:hypothetical protein
MPAHQKFVECRLVLKSLLRPLALAALNEQERNEHCFGSNQQNRLDGSPFVDFPRGRFLVENNAPLRQSLFVDVPAPQLAPVEYVTSVVFGQISAGLSPP